MAQIIINGLSAGAVYGFMALGLGLLYAGTRVLNFSFVVGYLFSGLIYASFNQPLTFYAVFPAFLGIICSMIYILGIDFTVIRQLEKRSTNSGGLFLAALALYILSVNLLSLFFGPETKGVLFSITPIRLFDSVSLGLSQQILILTYFGSSILFYILINHSAFGRRVKAFASDMELATLFGYDIRYLRVQVILCAGFLAGLSGVLATIDHGIAPYDGIDIMLIASAAWIIGGPRNLLGGLWAGILLGIARSAAAQYGAGSWIDGIPFAIFVLFVVLFPERLRSAVSRSDTIGHNKEI